jgi:galactofuranose transport system ATP-binding protein
VLLARWLITQPKLLILDEPTRGTDVGAKAQIQKLVASLSEEGMAVVYISAELEEVLRLSHKVAVLRDRRMIAELPNEGTTVGDIMEIIAAEAAEAADAAEPGEQVAVPAAEPVGDTVRPTSGGPA